MAACSASVCRPHASQHRVSSSSDLGLKTPGMSARSSPPHEAVRTSIGPLGLAGFDEGGGERDGCCADQALIEAACEDVVLLGHDQRQVEVAGGERRE